jgi:integrase
MSTPRPRRGFGNIRKLKSGRFQARYADAHGKSVTAPSTFSKVRHAEQWLAKERQRIDEVLWHPEVANRPERVLFGEYAQRWVVERRTAGRPLKALTQEQYGKLLDRHLLPAWGNRELSSITPADVRQWHAALLPDAPTKRSYAYRVLHAIMRTAFIDELIAADPCRLQGAGQAQRAHQVVVATIPEIDAATAAMPPHLRLAVSLSVWTQVRFGELTELRRKDVDVAAQVVHVRRGVVRLATGQFHVGTPKSKAGIRDVSMPRHIMGQLEHHLANYVAAGRDSLLFPAHLETPLEHLPHSLLNYRWSKARKAAGREDLHWHDLRHTGATMTAQAGATTAELMARIGHSSAQAALVYQHAAKGRDAEIAAQLSKLYENG